MSQDNLMDALYKKMCEEQKEYHKYLITQPAEEILHHAYEYSMREDILFAMEDINLENDKIKALLESENPLADIYINYAKMETDHMESIRYSIESYAHKAGERSLKEQLNEKMRGNQYYKYSDGFFDYYVNKATGEKKFKLDEGDIEVDSNLDNFMRPAKKRSGKVR